MTLIFYDICSLKIIELVLTRCNMFLNKINKIGSSASNSWFSTILAMTIAVIFIKCQGKQISLGFHYLITVMFPVIKDRLPTMDNIEKT